MLRSRLPLVLAALASLAGCATTAPARHAPPTAETDPRPPPPASEPIRKVQAPKPAPRPPEPPPTPVEPPAPPSTTAAEFVCGPQGKLERRQPTERPAGVVAYDGSSMTRPEKLSGPPPTYTLEALNQNAQGQLIARCILTREGLVRSCRILKPLPPLEEAVLSSLCASLYSPVMKDGQPVDAEYTFNVRLSPP